MTIEETKELGNGEFTLENLTRGDHVTFRLKTRKRWENRRVWELMIGKDNNSDYQGFAHIGEDGAVIPWRKKVFVLFKVNPKTGNRFSLNEGVSLVQFIMNEGKFGAVHGEGETVEKRFNKGGMEYALRRSCRCARCNRLLTNPESIQQGMGPECITR
jgi:hypothetical protein